MRFFCVPLILTFPAGKSRRCWESFEDPLRLRKAVTHQERIYFTTTNLYAN